MSQLSLLAFGTQTHLWEVHFGFEGGGKQPHGLMLQVVEGANAPHGKGLYLIILTYADAPVGLQHTHTHPHFSTLFRWWAQQSMQLISPINELWLLKEPCPAPVSVANMQCLLLKHAGPMTS